MVLVDTSIWIRYLQDRPPFAAELQALLRDDLVTGHELVYGELLIGDNGGRRKHLEIYDQIYWAGRVPHAGVVAFVRAHQLSGRGVSWIDVSLLASAYAAKIPFWTADARLRQIAEELGIAYHSE